MAEHANTTPTPITRRRRAAPALAGVDPHTEETTPNPDLDPTKVRARRATNYRNEKFPPAQVGNVITLRPRRDSQPSALMAAINDMERLLDARDAARAVSKPSPRVIPFPGKIEHPSISQHELFRRVNRVLRLAADWGVGHLVMAVGPGGAA
jgi:hypothetical protein